jgi:hypothetical protein
MNKGFHLANSSFDAIVKGGGFRSIKCTKDQAETQFVLSGETFSEFFLDIYNGVDTIHWVPGKDENYQDSETCEQKRKFFQTGSINEHGLKIESYMKLEGGRLSQRITVTNTGSKNIAIGNAGFSLPCNTEFVWGESAVSKVIGHHFISSHGSHNIYTRCDGKGPFLVMLPAGDTKLVYYDLASMEQAKVNPEKAKKILCVYTLGEKASKDAAEKGSRRGKRDKALILAPGEKTEYEFLYVWASDYKEARELLVENNSLDIEVFPGMTVQRDGRVMVSVRGKYKEVSLTSNNPLHTEITGERRGRDTFIYQLRFHKLGENTIKIEYGCGKEMYLEFFVTEAIEILIRKRGAFIADKQIRDKDLWYDGLLAEWNNETGVLLSPDNYDKVKGWRIYEVTCDDPGLSKPAYLSGKLAEYPVQQEVEALDYYIENFVWGGLQCTEEEEFPYGIYGIPDWQQNRTSDNTGARGRLHIWRIYDYPHIFMMYYNMYRVSKNYKDIKTALKAGEYLQRAYRTALAMFLIPSEIAEWSAYKTGLYNEWVIPFIIQSLKEEGETEKAERLSIHWKRKVTYFVNECKDIFGSEYPFDTTGFESTHIFAKEALESADRSVKEKKEEGAISYADAVRFMEYQTSCNIACRGYLEHAYYWYGSDYRSNNFFYTLSYMSQMGGYSLLDYALHYAEEPYSLLRLAYGSMLSSWALLNSGDEESNYGYWFPGKEHDGAASGGFEPLPYGTTWLDQPHLFGPWYYSCEIDLGFCGALHGMAVIYTEDPLFGKVVYGGELTEDTEYYHIKGTDGVGRRFHYLADGKKLHITFDKGHFALPVAVSVQKNLREIHLFVERKDIKEDIPVMLSLENELGSTYEIVWGETILEKLKDGGKAQYALSASDSRLILRQELQ